MNQFSRTELLIGQDAVNKLNNSTVAVFGIGGVGGYVCEALARSGVGKFVLVDNDVVSETNINRQIIALHSTVGKYKTEVMKERILDINPKACVQIYNCFFLPENSDQFDFSKYDYVVDAVDTVSAKVQLISQSKENSVSVISSMGAGNKMDPAKFQIADISKTSVCPLARVLRRELKKRNIKNVKCVFSTEEPLVPVIDGEYEKKGNGPAPGSISFVPSVAGLMIAGEVIKDLIKK